MKNLQKIESITDLQKNYKALGENYLAQRFTDNPEFQKKFIATFSDMAFNAPDALVEVLPKMKPNTLLNAVYKATEIGASFGKREISLLPFKENKVDEKGVSRQTGFYYAVPVVDINYQKQMIMRLPNCKRFFTAEVHEGVKVLEDLNTGNYIFDGENNASKPTIGYYACFIDKNDVKTDLFLFNHQIVKRATEMNATKEKLYKETSFNVHYEKIVIRNLLKDIPQISNELEATLSYDEVGGDYEVIEIESVDELNEAKKDLNILDESSKKTPEPQKEKEPEKEKSLSSLKDEAPKIKPTLDQYF